MHIKNIFVTGPMKIGKSTILNQVIERLPGWKLAGFRTIPIYENNKKCGFMFDSLDGNPKIFAHTELKTQNKFDIYQFDQRIFEEAGVSTLRNAMIESDLILMDEIGMMEKEAHHFTQAILDCLNAPAWVLGAVQKRASWLLNILIKRTDTKIFDVDEENRTRIADQVMELIKSRR
jgi:nucleoside-triphosphatase